MPINYAEAISDLAEECAEVAESKGFLDNELGEKGQVIAKIDLIHTEVSEVIEVYRQAYDDDDLDLVTWMTPMQEEDFVEELADVIIRSLDLAGHLDLSQDLGNAVVMKIEKNKGRPYKHGKRF